MGGEVVRAMLARAAAAIKSGAVPKVEIAKKPADDLPQQPVNRLSRQWPFSPQVFSGVPATSSSARGAAAHGSTSTSKPMGVTRRFNADGSKFEPPPTVGEGSVVYLSGQRLMKTV